MDVHGCTWMYIEAKVFSHTQNIPVTDCDTHVQGSAIPILCRAILRLSSAFMHINMYTCM